MKKSEGNWIFAQLEYLQFVFLIIFYFCVIDGTMASRKAKIFISVAICTYYILRGIAHFISSPKYDNAILKLPIGSGGCSLSIYSKMLNSEYSLCLFMFKQTLTLIMNKDRCVNIVQTPYIKWE